MTHLDGVAAGSVIIAINSNPKEMACCVAWQPGSTGAGKPEWFWLYFSFILILLLISKGSNLLCRILHIFRLPKLLQDLLTCFLSVAVNSLQLLANHKGFGGFVNRAS